MPHLICLYDWSRNASIMKVVYNTKYLEYYSTSTKLSSTITGGLQVIPSLYFYETAAYNMDSFAIKKVKKKFIFEVYISTIL